MSLNWDQIEADYQEIIKRLADASLDKKERASLQKKASDYSNLLSCHKEIEEITQEVDDLQKTVNAESDEQMKALFVEEVSDAQKKLEEKEKELDDFLYPADERDERSVFLEIRSGAGGQDYRQRAEAPVASAR